MAGLFTCAIILLGFFRIICILSAHFSQPGNYYPLGEAEFKLKWPELDDNEFMKRCTPGTNRDTALRTRRIVAKQTGIPYENIYPEQSFVNDLDFDS